MLRNPRLPPTVPGRVAPEEGEDEIARRIKPKTSKKPARTPQASSHPYASMRKILTLCALCALAGCTASDSARSPAAPTVLSAPPGVGSAQPFVSTLEDAVLLSWLEPSEESGHDLWLATLGPDGWEDRRKVAHGDDFFVNWADFPSVVSGADGNLWAHWLQNEEGTGLAYGVRLAHSTDEGRSWSEPWTPHEDGTPTEHGFVSVFPLGDGVGLVWLDGRKYAAGAHGEPTREMTVRFRRTAVDAPPGAETLVDGRACDCCQTDAALTSRGPVIVYRNRTQDEVRDIHVARFEGDRWSEGTPVYDDGWVISGCPVNGPAVAASGEDVVVAWFTAAGDAPVVQVAFSDDAGTTFGPPTRVDDGNPAGRVDVLMSADGSAVVSWLERTGGEGAEVRTRRVGADGAVGPASTITGSSSARASGFPRMVALPWEPSRILVAWTDIAPDEGPHVRVATMEAPSR